MANDLIRIGNVELISIADMVLNSPAASFFASAPPADLEANLSYFGCDGAFPHPAGCFVVRSSGKTILVDTGYGPARDGQLCDKLRARGISLADISLVAFTHLHPDHVGWNVTHEGSSAKPTFTNARYSMPRADFDFFAKAKNAERFPHIKDQVLPLVNLGLVDLVEPEQDLSPELRLWSTPGHTPGHVSILINSAGAKGIILGDVAHSPVQVHETDWASRPDIDPDQARATRHSVFDRLEQEGLTVAAGHFPEPGFGKLVRVEGRRIWQAC